MGLLTTGFHWSESLATSMPPPATAKPLLGLGESVATKGLELIRLTSPGANSSRRLSNQIVIEINNALGARTPTADDFPRALPELLQGPLAGLLGQRWGVWSVQGTFLNRFAILQFPALSGDSEMLSLAHLLESLPIIRQATVDPLVHKSVTRTSFNDPGWAQQFDSLTGVRERAAFGANSLRFNPMILELTEYLRSRPSGAASLPVVAVVDSGYYPSVDSGQSPSTYAAEATILNGIFSPGAQEPLSNEPSHGTSVAGLLSAPQNNNYAVAGIGNFPISMVRVFPSAQEAASASDVVQGILYAANRHSASLSSLPNPAPAKVINLSLGSDGSAIFDCPTFLQAAIDEVVNAGSVVIAAAGNESSVNLSTPANCRNVVSVGAVNFLGISSGYSNVTEDLVISTFGGDSEFQNPYIVVDPLRNNGVGQTQGTSFSTPVMSAFVATALSLQPTLRASQIIDALRATQLPYAQGFCAGVQTCGGVFNAQGFMQRYGVDLSQFAPGTSPAPAPGSPVPSPGPVPSPAPSPGALPDPGTGSPTGPEYPAVPAETPKGFVAVQVFSFTATGAIESIRLSSGQALSNESEAVFDQGRVLLKLVDLGEHEVYFNNAATGADLRRFAFRIRKTGTHQFDIGQVVELSSAQSRPPVLAQSVGFDGTQNPYIAPQLPDRSGVEAPESGGAVSIGWAIGLLVGLLGFKRKRASSLFVR